MPSLCNAKRECLEKQLGLKFEKGMTNFVAKCGFCGKKIEGTIRISKYNNAWQVNVNGQFHHLDGNRDNNDPENLVLLCYTCHKRFHQWGVIQRWLKKCGKTVDDLPDCSSLKVYFNGY